LHWHCMLLASSLASGMFVAMLLGVKVGCHLYSCCRHHTQQVALWGLAYVTTCVTTSSTLTMMITILRLMLRPKVVWLTKLGVTIQGLAVCGGLGPLWVVEWWQRGKRPGDYHGCLPSFYIQARQCNYIWEIQYCIK
jgi:hypothetical protein